MSFEEEFDSIIRRKAEEEKYPFDENNWDKASSFLDADRKAARALKLKKFYLPAVLAVVIGSAGFITFGYFNTEKSGDKNVAVNTSILPSEKSTASTSVSNPSESSVPNKVQEIETNSKEKTITENKLNPSVSVSGKDQKTTSAPITAPLAIKGNSSENVHPSIKKEVVMANNFEAPIQQSNFEATDTKNKSAVSETKSFANEKQTDKTSDQNAGPESSSSTHDVESVPSKPTNDLVYSNTSNQNAPLAKNDSPKQNKESEIFVENQININTTEESKLNAEQLSAVYSSLPFEMNESDLLSTPFVYLDRYDDDYYKNTKAPKKHYLNIEVGANYLLGWDANKGKDGQGLNGFAGFNYGRYLSNKISISVGLQAYNIANIQQPFYLVASKEYGFGSKNIYTRVTSNQLYYVALPLKFNYAINTTNSIGFGVNVAYLVGAGNTVSKYYLLDNEEKSIGSSTTHNKGIYTGTNMVNMMLSAHYKTQFGKRIGLNLEFNYGVSDIFKNTDAIKTSEKPMGIRLGLSYTLFDK